MRLPTASHLYNASPRHITEAEQPKNSSSPLSDTALYLQSITWSDNGVVNLNILGNLCIQQSNQMSDLVWHRKILKAQHYNYLLIAAP